jgi:hypothetical protein
MLRVIGADYGGHGHAAAVMDSLLGGLGVWNLCSEDADSTLQAASSTVVLFVTTEGSGRRAALEAWATAKRVSLSGCPEKVSIC